MATTADAATSATPSAFTPGDIVVYRVGDGTTALSSAASGVFLDEYTPTGTLVQSIRLPTTANGANNPLTASGTSSSEGLLSLGTVVYSAVSPVSVVPVIATSIPAGKLPVGTSTITVTYAGTAYYAPSSTVLKVTLTR